MHPIFAYHYDKISRGFDELIDVFGADHGGYVKRMKAAVSALSDGKVPLDIKLCQLVKLFKDGQEFKMSKRAGTFVTLRDVVEAVGADVTRFMLLTRKNDQGFDFDLDKALEQSKDNPVFYVQYANARICSTLRKAAEVGFETSDTVLQGADLRLRSAIRRSWLCCRNWQNGRARSKLLPAATSRTGSPFTSMISHPSCTRCTILGRQKLVYYLLTRAANRQHMPIWRWRAAFPLLFPQGLVFLASNPAQEMRKQNRHTAGLRRFKRPKSSQRE